MSRTRVRRSFTVESKSRGRQAPALLPIRAALLTPQAQPAAEFRLSPAEDPFAPRPEPRPEPRRVLPSLLASPEPEPVVEVTPEPRLPRVRRVKATAKPEIALPFEPITVPVPAVLPPDIVVGAPSAAAAREGERRVSRRPARGDAAALPLGERWKRRLPRVCW